jgi:hypothetical protein
MSATQSIVQTLTHKPVYDHTGGERVVWFLLNSPTSAWLAEIDRWAAATPSPVVTEILSTLVAAFTELPLNHDADVIAPDPMYFT